MYTPTKNDSLPKSTGQNFHSVIDDTVSEVKDDLNCAVTKVEKGALKLFDNAIDAVNDEYNHIKDTVTTRIRSNPVQSSAIALGVGFILGALIRR